jgi:hypothetical protein
MVFPIVGGNQATGDFITNSLRFEDGGSPYLTHTRGTATNEKKFTFSTWVKLGNTGHGVNGTLFGSGDDGNGYVGDALIIQTNGLVKQGDHDGSTDNHNVRTNALLRDPSAWYHIVAACDSTQGTDSNRIKLYINGTQQTSLAATTYPSQNITFDCNTNGQVLNIGRNQNGENHVYFDGYMAETVFIDGQQLAASSFGETDDNGVWIPKDISKEGLTFGNNGFYLQYQQTGTSADASGKGADTSGEDTHFDDNGMTAEDITTDTPQNNFATMNSLASIATLSEGNCKAVTTDGERMAGASTIGFENGKWYMEYKITDINSINVIVGIDNDSGRSFHEFRDNVNFWDASNSYGYQNDGNKRTTSVNSSYGNSYTTGDIIGIAVDMDNRKIYFSKNGTYQNSGDPTTGSTGTGSAFDLTDGLTYFFQAADQDSLSGFTVEANFGQPSFSISSGNADANGHGNFEYAPPSGYYALNTKNLAEFG